MKKAFTLIELLVVIGIIAILCGVLLSALRGSTDAAKAAKCLTNLHGLAMGAHARSIKLGIDSTKGEANFILAGSIIKYADFGGKKVTVSHGWIGWSEDSTSGSYISPYNQDYESRYHSLTNGTVWKEVSENADLFVCPLHREAFLKANPSAKYGPCWSYAMNAWFRDGATGDKKPSNKSQDAPYDSTWQGQVFLGTENKNKILMFAELPFVKNDIVSDVEFNAGASAENDPVLQYPGSRFGGTEAIAFNHRTGKREIYAHVCYADGHTEKLLLPRGASMSNIKDLTYWMCEPGDDFDVVLDGGQYKKLKN